MAFTGSKPTHKIKAKGKVRGHERSHVVGVGWLAANGSLSIQLNVGVVLSWTDDVLLTAFPIDPKDKDNDDD
jgi:hypothetical protein